MKIKYLFGYGITGLLMLAFTAFGIAFSWDYLNKINNLIFLITFALAIIYLFLAFKQRLINKYTNLSLFFWYFVGWMAVGTQLTDFIFVSEYTKIVVVSGLSLCGVAGGLIVGLSEKQEKT